MKSIRKLFFTWIPRYAWYALLLIAAYQSILYFGSSPLVSAMSPHMMSTALDDALPLVPAFIYIYMLAFLQWALGYVIITRDSRERCFRFLSGHIIAVTVSVLIFLIYPTAIRRSPLEATDFTTRVLSLIWKLDSHNNLGVNLFPSLHCLVSWLCFRGAIGLKKTPGWYVWFQLCFTLLVFASTLLVKQHIWPDILGGVAIAELGLGLARLLHGERIFEALGFKTKE